MKSVQAYFHSMITSIELLLPPQFLIFLFTTCSLLIINKFFKMNTDPDSRNKLANMANIKLPPFNAENTHHYLRMVDQAFKIYSISEDQDKAFLLITSLPFHLQTELSHTLETQSENKFELIKNALIEKTTIPERERMHKLLHEAVMGDRKPSAFLRHLRELAGNDSPDGGLIRSIFLERLPNRIVVIIAPKSDQDLDSIAEFADRIYAHMDNSTSFSDRSYINNISATNDAFSPNVNSPNDFSATINLLTDKVNRLSMDRNVKQENQSVAEAINRLNTQITALNTNFTSALSNLSSQISNLQSSLNTNERHSRSTSRNNYNRNTIPENQNNGICYYHRRFKHDAKYCTKPCSWKDSQPSTSGN